MQIHPFLPGIRHIRDLTLFPNFEAIFVVKRILLIGLLDPVFLKKVPLSLNERLCAHFTSYAFKLINMKCLMRLGFLYLPQLCYGSQNINLTHITGVSHRRYNPGFVTVGRIIIHHVLLANTLLPRNIPPVSSYSSAILSSVYLDIGFALGTYIWNISKRNLRVHFSRSDFSKNFCLFTCLRVKFPSLIKPSFPEPNWPPIPLISS